MPAPSLIRKKRALPAPGAGSFNLEDMKGKDMIDSDQISAIEEYQWAARQSAAIVGLFAFLKDRMVEKDGFIYITQDDKGQGFWRALALAADFICYEHAMDIAASEEE